MKFLKHDLWMLKIEEVKLINLLQKLSLISDDFIDFYVTTNFSNIFIKLRCFR